MNTIDTTNALEKDKTVNSDQKQFTSAETEPKRQTSFVSQFDTQTSPKKETKQNVKLSANDVHVYYGDSEAIKGIDISIYENEVIAFIGPSGCGKSTFLRTLNRMNVDLLRRVPKKKRSKTLSSVLMMCMSIMVIAKRLKALISVFMKMK